jgi:OOP family OmpA-OmpF porin
MAKKLLFITLLVSQILAAQDATGCKDSPLISRFPGSVITNCKNMEDDVFEFTMSPKPKKRIEGEFHQIEYRFPKTASKAQVVRNLNTAMRRAGYTFDYDSGDYGDFTVHMGSTWIQIEISNNGSIVETIVKEIALKQEVVADAAALSTGLTATGHIVATGLLFDTGKAEVKPESAAALQEIAKLLKENSKLKLYVVGHTDNAGTLDANIDLSKRRAAAVVQALTSQYAIPSTRLQPFGNGPYAPLASNDSEDGRTQNRRVELVKQ